MRNEMTDIGSETVINQNPEQKNKSHLFKIM